MSTEFVAENEYEEYARLQQIVEEKKAELKALRHDINDAINASKKRANLLGITNVFDKIDFVKQECAEYYAGIDQLVTEIEELQAQSDAAWEAYEIARMRPADKRTENKTIATSNILGSIAQDTKGRERYIKVLAGFRKPSGTICACIEDHGTSEKHHVKLFPDGSFSCCGKFACFHVEALRLISSLFTEDGYMEKEQAPKSMQYCYH